MMELIPNVKISSQIYCQRFRYGKENRGGRKHREEDFMEVTLQNIPEGAELKVFCVKAADSQYPHPNSVDGHNCNQGVYCHPPLRRHCVEETLKIPWLQINRTKKGDMARALEERQAVLPPKYQGACQALMESMGQGAKEDTNQVYLCVHVSWTNHPGVFDVSRLIKNQDKCSSLKIDELSQASVSVDGGRILILMAEDSPAIEPEEIEVKIEELDADNRIEWTSETFTPAKEDIRYKHVIAYHVPRYKVRQILEPVRVNVVIRCDQTNVEVKKEILYTPLPEFVALNRGKRKPSVAEKYGHKVLKLTEQRCVKEELRNKIKSAGGTTDLHCQPSTSFPSSTTNVPFVEHCVFQNHGNVPHTEDNGLGSSNDLLRNELPDFLPPQQAPFSQEAGLDQLSQPMETDLIQTQKVTPLIHVPLSIDTGGRSRQLVAMFDETSCSSPNVQNHDLPQPVVDLASAQDSVPDSGVPTVAPNSAPCDKLTMMKRCLQNQQLNQVGDSTSAKMEHIPSIAATTDGNQGVHVQTSEQNGLERSHGNTDFQMSLSGGHNPLESSPRLPEFQMHALEPNNLTSSPGQSGFREPRQGGMESSQGISGFQMQNHDPDLGNSNGNPQQNVVPESPAIAGQLPSLDVFQMPSADLENLLAAGGVFNSFFDPSQTSPDEHDPI